MAQMRLAPPQQTYRSTIQEIDPLWTSTERDLSNPDYQEWLKRKNQLMLAELRNLREHSRHLPYDIELEGAVKAFMSAGRKHGPYEQERTAWQASARGRKGVWLPKEGGRICFERGTGQGVIRMEDTEGVMRVINCKKFFTIETPEDNLLKHVANAVQDSDEWKCRSSTCMLTPSELAQRILSTYPGVECRRDEGTGYRKKRFENVKVYRFLQSIVQGSPADVLQDHLPHPKELLAQTPTRENVTIVKLSRTSAEIREVLLQSDLALEAQANGIDVEPGWANGAKLFVAVSPSHFPYDFPPSELRPWYVIIAKKDFQRLESVLQALSCKKRPLLKSSETNEQGTVCNYVDLTYSIAKTFVYVTEPFFLTPRSSKYAASSNDKRSEHANPRKWAWRGSNLPCSAEAISSKSNEQPSQPLSEHMSRLKDCQKRRDFDGAIQCYSSMLRDDCKPDAKVFSILIDVAGKTCHYEDVARLMQTMTDKGIPPNEITLNCAINAFAKARDLDKARHCFEQLERQGMQQTLVAYNCVIKAFVREGYINEAEQWLGQVQGIQKPNEFSFGIFLDHFARQGLFDKAEAWFEKKVDAGLTPSRADFGNMVTAYAKVRDLEGVRKWFGLMRKAGVQPEVYEYTQLLNACAPCKKISVVAKPEKAKEIFMEQLQNDIRPDHFNCDALAGALGHHEAHALCDREGVDYKQLKREYDALKQDTGVAGWKSWKFNVASGEFKNNSFD